MTLEILLNSVVNHRTAMNSEVQYVGMSSLQITTVIKPRRNIYGTKTDVVTVGKEAEQRGGGVLQGITK